MSDSPEDRDELARLRGELDAANRKLTEVHRLALLGRLSAGVVHEIKTPIGSIFSNNEVIIGALDKIKDLLSGGAVEIGAAAAASHRDARYYRRPGRRR